MHTRWNILIGLGTLALFSCATCDPDVMKSIMNTNDGVTEGEVVQGLKAALDQGTEHSTGLLSQVNGYLGNPLIKIPFPPEAQKIETTLRSIGSGKLCDDVINSINHAAEDAAGQAAPILLDAIKQMTIQDAMNILFGSDTAATSYLRKTTSVALTGKFRPVIENSLDKVDATRYWSTAVNAYNKIPFTEDLNPDLAGYVTQKALDGLFYEIGQEELRIRQDPAARAEDILKKVFGYYDTHK